MVFLPEGKFYPFRDPRVFCKEYVSFFLINFVLVIGRRVFAVRTRSWLYMFGKYVQQLLGEKFGRGGLYNHNIQE